MPFRLRPRFQLVRKLEVERNTNTTPQPDITWTNQMYLMNITNYMGLSCWNSYRTNYPGPVDILVRCGSSMMLTNDNNLIRPITFRPTSRLPRKYLRTGQHGVAVRPERRASFIVPLNTSFMTLTNAIYYYGGPNSRRLILFAGDNPDNYLDKGIRELPHFWLMMTNRLQVAIIDYSTNVSPLNASAQPLAGLWITSSLAEWTADSF